MPMDFPDMRSLIMAAKVHKFRKPDDKEPEVEYRNALANHVKARDLIESEEIRNGCGWDKWDKSQKGALLGRTIFNQE